MSETAERPRAQLDGIVTLPELASILLMSEAMIGKHVADGVLQRAGRGAYDALACVHAMIRFYRARLGIRGDAGDRAAVAGPDDSDKGRLLKARASLLENKADVATGKVLPRERVDGGWCSILGALRTRMLAIPSATAPLWASAMTAADAEAALTRAIHEALAELSRIPVYAPAHSDRGAGSAAGDDAEGVGDSETAAEADDFAVG